MNYLEICQFAQAQMGATNVKPWQGPTTVVGQQDVMLEIVKNCAMAYKDIQNDQDYWSFMQQQGTFVLPNGTRVLTKAALEIQIPTYETLMPDLIGGGYRYLQIWRTATGVGGMVPCMYVPYQQWRGNIDSNVIPDGMPYMYTIRPDEAIEFNVTANEDFTFSCDYYQKVIEWVQVDVGPVLADDQTPIFPARFHEAVAWRGVMYWSGFVEGAGKYGFAQENYNRIMQDMRIACMPELLLSTREYYGGMNMGYGGGWY